LQAWPLGQASNRMEEPFPDCYVGWLTRDPDGSPNGETSPVTEGLVGFRGIGHLDSVEEFQVPAFFDSKTIAAHHAWWEFPLAEPAMPTQQATVDLLLKKLENAGPLTARKMFGEYCIYLNEKPVALVCDDTLFVKITNAGRVVAGNAPEGSPYPGAKPHFMFDSKSWSRAKSLVKLLQVTFEELPAPKPKKPRMPRQN
jgi:DNA transformation protein and related proteins